MHIMEGFLPWQWCLFWYLLSIPVIVWGAYHIRKLFREHPEKKIMVAVSGAFIFVLSSLKLPSVTGSSSHPTGTGISTALFGVGITAVLSTIVLVFQAILLAHGGITTLGANVFSMGIAGPFVGLFVYKGVRKVSDNVFLCGFVIGFITDLVTYAVTAVQLSLAFPSAGGFLPSFVTFMAIYALTQIPLAVAEGVLTGLFFNYLSESRPEYLDGVKFRGSRMSKRARNAVAMVVSGLVLMAFVITRIIGLEGSDDAGSNAILNIDPNYVPWWNNLFELSQTQEIILFAVQMLIGIAIIVYALRYYKSGKAIEGGPKNASD